MTQKISVSVILLLSSWVVLTAQKISILAKDLSTPVGLEFSNEGILWLTQTGTGNDDGKVTMITQEGEVHDVVIGLPSLFNVMSGEITGAWRTYQLPENRLLVVVGEGEHMLSSSLLTYDLSNFTPGIAPLFAEDYESVINVRDFTLGLGAENSNPYSVAWNKRGDMFIVDAAANAIIKRDINTDTLSVFARFPPLSNPTSVGPPFIDFVPTKLIADGANGFYLSNLTGFPFLNGIAYVTTIDSTGTLGSFVTDTTRDIDSELDLTLAVDMAVDPTDGNVVVLQFAEFSMASGGFLPGSARLSKLYKNGQQEVLAKGFGPAAGLTFASNGDAYVSNIFNSEVLKIEFVVPENDNLCDATSLTVGIRDSTPNISIAYASAETNEPNTSCSMDSIIYNSVWFSFIAPENDIFILAAADEPTIRNFYKMSIYSLAGPCSDLNNLVEIACSTPEQNLWSSPSIILSDLVAGETYYIQISGRRSADMLNTFSDIGIISVIEISIPENDAACQAIPLELGAGAQIFSNIGATTDPTELSLLPPPTLFGVNNDGWEIGSMIEHSVWFTFTTPEKGGLFSLDLLSSLNLPGSFNSQAAIFKVGDCSNYSTYELVGMADNAIAPDPDLSGQFFLLQFNPILDQLCLEGNTTYYILVDGHDSFFGGSTPTPDQGYFSLEAKMDLPPQSVIDSILSDGFFNGVHYNSDTSVVDTLSSSKGCDSLVITNISVTTTSLEDNDWTNAIRLYPNPTREYLNVSIDGIEKNDINLTIRNVYGLVVYKGTIPTGDSRLTIPNLVAGHYIVEFRCGYKVHINRFLKL